MYKHEIKKAFITSTIDSNRVFGIDRETGEILYAVEGSSIKRQAVEKVASYLLAQGYKITDVKAVE